MAAALTKNGRLSTTHNTHSLKHFLSRRSLKCATPDPITSPHKRVARFAHSIFRKAREAEFSPPISVSSESSLRPLSSSSQKSGLVGWYLSMLRTRPVSTKCITSALIYAAADVSSQAILSEDSEDYDSKRTARMAGYGLVLLGPSVHYWYNFMSRVLPKRDLSSTLMKLALGQTTYGPAMTVIFLSVNAALQGETGQEILARLRRDLLPTLINGAMYWPLCDFVTFRFIPVHLQPLVTNSFSYLWTIYMTYTASLVKVGPN